MTQKVFIGAEYPSVEGFKYNNRIVEDYNTILSDANDHIMMEHHADPEYISVFNKGYNKREDGLPSAIPVFD